MRPGRTLLTSAVVVGVAGLVLGLAFAHGGGDDYEPISGSVVLTPRCPTPDPSDWVKAPISGKPAFGNAVDLDRRQVEESYRLLVEVAAVHRSAGDCGSSIVLESVGPSRPEAVILAGVAARPRREADCDAPLRRPEQRVWPLPGGGGRSIPAFFCVRSTAARDYAVTARLDQRQRVLLDFRELTRGKSVIR